MSLGAAQTQSPEVMSKTGAARPPLDVVVRPGPRPPPLAQGWLPRCLPISLALSRLTSHPGLSTVLGNSRRDLPRW